MLPVWQLRLRLPSPRVCCNANGRGKVLIVYLSATSLGQSEGASAPAPSKEVEAYFVSRLETLRDSIDAQRKSDTFFNEVHRFMAGVIGGGAIGYFCSEQKNRSKSARIGAIVGGASQLVVGILVSAMRSWRS